MTCAYQRTKLHNSSRICARGVRKNVFSSPFFKKYGLWSVLFPKNVVPLPPQTRKDPLGEMVEWSITAVLKTAVLRGTGGSNPSLSALRSLLISAGFFYFNLTQKSQISRNFFDHGLLGFTRMPCLLPLPVVIPRK